jgi:hypothetical protein
MTTDTIIMSASDVATLLKIKESTLRKYALLLQKNGYHFDTNDKGQRAYYNKDVVVLKKLIEIKSGSDMTLEQSVNAVMAWLKASGVTLLDTPNKSLGEPYNDDIKELVDKVDLLAQMMKHQMDFNETLVKKLNEKDEYIRSSLEKRDQLLLTSIRDSQERKKEAIELEEVKQLLLEQRQATKEIAVSLDKKPWWKFWG